MVKTLGEISSTEPIAQYNYVVADAAERATLTGMTIGDTIFQEDTAGIFVATSSTASESSAEGVEDDSISTSKIADDAITEDKIADNAVNSQHYTDGSIDTEHLSDDAVTGDKVADNAIDSEHYTDGSIDNEHLANDSVTSDKIANDSIDSEHYVDGSIDEVHLSDRAVTRAKMGNIASGKLLGRASDGTGIVEELTPAELGILDVEDGISSDEEALAGTSEDTVVNAKQNYVVLNGAHGAVSSSLGTEGGIVTSSSVFIPQRTIAKFSCNWVYPSSGNATSYLESSEDNVTWNNVYTETFSGSNTSLSFTFMLKPGLYYRTRTDKGYSNSGSASTQLQYTT